LKWRTAVDQEKSSKASFADYSLMLNPEIRFERVLGSVLVGEELRGHSPAKQEATCERRLSGACDSYQDRSDASRTEKLSFQVTGKSVAFTDVGVSGRCAVEQTPRVGSVGHGRDVDGRGCKTRR
jgi:hypothetical protein